MTQIIDTPPFTMPRIGDAAPAFTAETTQGPIDFPADYAGSWVILFSHPADFTPVCTTEFMTFAAMQDEFASLNTKLVGVSVDGLFSHIAWLRTIKEKITYRDLRTSKSRSPSGRQHAAGRAPLRDDHAGRGLDQDRACRLRHRPRRYIRTIVYYPQSVGRNVDELRRVVIALQTTDAFSVATPADWRPGEAVIVPPAGSCGVAKDRMDGHESGVSCIDWFFCTKEITEDQIIRTLSPS